VPQTPEPISAVSGPKLTILQGHVEELLLFNRFFRLSIYLVAKIQLKKVVRCCRNGVFASFLRPVFPASRVSTFQICILNSH